MISGGRRPSRWFSFIRSNKVVTLATALVVATATLVWLGYEATRDASQTRKQLIERRVTEQIALLSAGLSQDMRGAHATVLVPVTPDQLRLEPPYDLADAFARGFARFPYPEFFFTWKEFEGEEVTYLFTRADRPPEWHQKDVVRGPYPVDVARNPAPMDAVIAHALQEARHERPVALFAETIAGTTYQVVVSYLYSYPNHLSGLVGFAVNLGWVRSSYFNELTGQIARIGGEPNEMSLEILDSSGSTVTSTRARHPEIPYGERRFPLAFVDRTLIGGLQVADSRGLDTWTARVGVARDSALSEDRTGSTFVLMSLAALASLAGLIVTVRGVRVAAELAAMQSDFVSTVTHELKTPLAVIRLIADTLAQSRYESLVTVREYSAFLRAEAANLGRLIDNLLSYARLRDVGNAYKLEPLDVAELIEDTLQHFRTLLVEQQFRVEIDLPPSLPSILADRTAMVMALDNVIDNAIKYSAGTRAIEIRAKVVDDCVVGISIADRGIGIGDDEIAQVSEKFFRGRGAKRGGSGLGLAIVREVVAAHGGRLEIDSRLGEGTRVEIFLRRAGAS